MSSGNLRRETRVETTVKVLVLRGKNAVPHETTDVSFKGLFLRATEPPPLRSLLRLKMNLPSREIEAHAMVVHVSDAGCGVQFWGLAGADRTAWEEFVRYVIEQRKSVGKSGERITVAPPSPTGTANK